MGAQRGRASVVAGNSTRRNGEKCMTLVRLRLRGRWMVE
jgi:hypothetical protein